MSGQKVSRKGMGRRVITGSGDLRAQSASMKGDGLRIIRRMRELQRKLREARGIEAPINEGELPDDEILRALSEHVNAVVGIVKAHVAREKHKEQLAIRLEIWRQRAEQIGLANPRKPWHTWVLRQTHDALKRDVRAKKLPARMAPKGIATLSKKIESPEGRPGKHRKKILE